jgi:hypothetical protein
MKKLRCPICLTDYLLHPTSIAAQRKAGLTPVCVMCGNPSLVAVTRFTGISDNQKRSRAQEKRAAKRIGGRVQPASGAGRSKGDVRDPGHVRMECKLTRSNSYSLKLADLQKIEKEATTGEHPIFEIEFQGVHPRKRYVVLPGWLYDSLSGKEIHDKPCKRNQDD